MFLFCYKNCSRTKDDKNKNNKNEDDENEDDENENDNNKYEIEWRWQDDKTRHNTMLKPKIIILFLPSFIRLS